MKRVPVQVTMPRLLRQRIALPEVCIPTAIPYRIFGKLRFVPIDYSNYFERLSPQVFSYEILLLKQLKSSLYFACVLK